MKIETKYDIGDEVWLEILGKPCLARIGAINITTNGKTIWCSYDVFCKEGHVYNAKNVYDTKRRTIKEFVV